MIAQSSSYKLEFQWRVVLSGPRQLLIELFKNFIENNETCDLQAINNTRGFWDCVKRDFNFNYLFPCYNSKSTKHMGNKLEKSTFLLYVFLI